MCVSLSPAALTADATLEQLELLESDTVSMRSYDVRSFVTVYLKCH